MNYNFFLLFLFVAFFGCKKQPTSFTQSGFTISKNVLLEENENELLLKSNKFNYTFAKSALPFKKAVFLNASLLGYVTALNAEGQIAGVSSPEYIYSEKIKSLIQQNKIQNVGNEQKYNVEKIIALNPDAVFTNYIASFENTYDLLRKNGIQVIFLDEYLEQKPLEKARYLLLFGKLLGKNDVAEKEFKKIEVEYKQIKELVASASNSPSVIANEMYGNQWFMPGGKTHLANYVSDAGGKYILAENNDEKAVPMSFEEVLAKSKDATVWLNAGNHPAKKSLLTVNPNYSNMNVFKKGKIYAVTAREKDKSNDFFESGVVRADLVLKDYVKILHPELLPDYQLTYMKELQ